MSTILHNNCNWQTKSCINRLSRIIVTDVCLWPLLMAICLLWSMCIYITARANTPSALQAQHGVTMIYRILLTTTQIADFTYWIHRAKAKQRLSLYKLAVRERKTLWMKQGLKGEKNLASRQGESLTRNCNALRLARPRAQSRDWTHVQNIPAPSLKIRLNTLVFK